MGYNETAEECRFGCLNDSDCQVGDECQFDEFSEDAGQCLSADDADQKRRQERDCDEAHRALESCGAITNADDFFLCRDPDSGDIYPEVSACILNWSDGVDCPDTLPDCLASDIECGPSYACPDGSTCDVNSGKCES